LAGGVVLGLTEKLQQERDSRRAKLNEILSKTREQSTGASPIKTSNSDTGLDASSLAKQLLAKRNINAGQPEQNVLTLHDELASLGNEFTLPGQIPDTHNNNVTHQ
jgi:hypothetical protein